MATAAHSVAQRSIDWPAAQAALEAAVLAAQAMGLRIDVAVVDHGGTLAAFLRMRMKQNSPASGT